MAETEGSATVAEADRKRLRAAWMYYVEQMTQSEIADVLGVGRVTVVRMLADARGRGEVQITVAGALAELAGIERRLEARYGLAEAVVAPLSGAATDATPVISMALGAWLSRSVRPGMRVGLGWGRTLLGSLPHVQPAAAGDVTVISLLGGIAEAHDFNPSEFAWRFAQIFGGDAYLIAAPAIVDGLGTRDALLGRCGLDVVMRMADALDLLVVSVGSLSPTSTTFRTGYLGEAQRTALAAAGAVGDVLFHFINAEGQAVDPALDDRVMSATVDQMRRAPVRVLASGGRDKTAALSGALRMLAPTVLITDEWSARTLLGEARPPQG